MKPIDDELEAKADIVARPEVTGGGRAVDPVPAKKPVQVDPVAETDADKNTGLLIADSVGRLFPELEDFRKAAIADACSGLFAGLRSVGFMPRWAFIGVLVTALAVPVIPAAIMFFRPKQEEKKDG